uniref:Uncharacterized protein n=1 Tax=Setaria italica TaxID=4555 RepID=K3ZMX7_SETIT
MAGAWKKHSVPALGWWLIAVGTFRSAFTWSCFFGGSASLCSATYSEIPTTFLSFVYAIGYLAVECLVYDTIRVASLVMFILVAGISMVWMLLHQRNSDCHHGPRPHGATRQP